MATETTRPETPSCSDCGNDPDAPCAGQPGCHGYWDGCDCPKCTQAHRRAMREDIHPPDPRWIKPF